MSDAARETLAVLRRDAERYRALRFGVTTGGAGSLADDRYNTRHGDGQWLLEPGEVDRFADELRAGLMARPLPFRAR